MRQARHLGLGEPREVCTPRQQGNQHGLEDRLVAAWSCRGQQRGHPPLHRATSHTHTAPRRPAGVQSTIDQSTCPLHSGRIWASPGKRGVRQNDSQLQRSVALSLHPPCPHLRVSLCRPRPDLLARIPSPVRPLATATGNVPAAASGSHRASGLADVLASNTWEARCPQTHRAQRVTCGVLQPETRQLCGRPPTKGPQHLHQSRGDYESPRFRIHPHCTDVFAGGSLRGRLFKHSASKQQTLTCGPGSESQSLPPPFPEPPDVSPDTQMHFQNDLDKTE